MVRPGQGSFQLQRPAANSKRSGSRAVLVECVAAQVGSMGAALSCRLGDLRVNSECEGALDAASSPMMMAQSGQGMRRLERCLQPYTLTVWMWSRTPPTMCNEHVCSLIPTCVETWGHGQDGHCVQFTTRSMSYGFNAHLEAFEIPQTSRHLGFQGCLFTKQSDAHTSEAWFSFL